MNEGKIYEEVQATLLNSECSPEYAVERALQAVVDFAVNELGLEENWEWDDLVVKALLAKKLKGIP